MTKPKRALSAYLFFSMEFMNNYKQNTDKSI